jgi:hypothetical protein
MNLYISTLMADEHRSQLMREASAYRAYRVAKTTRRAASARRKGSAAVAQAVPARVAPAVPSSTVYCSRAAAISAQAWAQLTSCCGTPGLGGTA